LSSINGERCAGGEIPGAYYETGSKKRLFNESTMY
jgi:hypothetical protein